MKTMNIETSSLPGVLILTPRPFDDHRGFFAETWSRPRMAEAGIDVEFVPDSHSLSGAAGTVRGLHFQSPPRAQAKLVRFRSRSSASRPGSCPRPAT